MPLRTCPTCGTTQKERLVCPVDGDVLLSDGAPGPETGRVLAGRYRLGNLLGEGGMGRVYTATLLANGSEVAVKVLRPELVGDSVSERRFRIEARAGSALDHPGAVKVLEYAAEKGGRSFIVMERLRGATLQDLRRAGKLASAERCIDILREVCDVLAAAHAKGIIHRDLKPSNIYLERIDRERSRAKVLDFGIAKLLDDGGDRLTSTGEFLGTLFYMAPEQSVRGAVTPALDVYSLGIILYEALTGSVPFSGRNPLEIIRLHATAPPPSLSALRPDIRPEVENLVLRCLAKKPEKRFRDAAELGRALSGTLEQSSPTERTVTSVLRMNPSSWVGVILDDRYEIGEWIASARFGSDVYRALHTRTGASVAVRVWRTGEGKVRDCLLEAFRGESKAMGVRHPSLITILDFGFNDDGVYIVTELVPGISLRSLLEQRGKLEEKVAVDLIRGPAEALGALHEKGIISGGLSPETIRVLGRESPVPPGAPRADDAEKDWIPERLLMTPLGLGCLSQIETLLPRGVSLEGDRSLDYISPEQGRGFPPDSRSDLYSLALILFEMLTGSIPRGGASALEGLRAEWGGFFEKALSGRREDRYPRAPELLAALPPV